MSVILGVLMHGRWPKQPTYQGRNDSPKNWPKQPRPKPQGGTLIFYIYIGLADFFGVKILKFSIFLGFQKYHYFFGK